MRALEAGESFIVTRGGAPVGELIPLRRRRDARLATVLEIFRGAPRVVCARISTRSPNARVAIDNQRFENCRFDRSTLTFGALGPVQLVGCTFNDCSFGFDGAAAATVKFMTELYQLAPQMIEATFDKIRLGM